MKSTTMCQLLTFLFILHGGVSFAQQERIVPHYEHLRGLEPFVGEWEGRYDPPGSVPAGICRVSAKWTGYKSYVRFNVTFTPDNTNVVLNPLDVYIGFDGKTQSTHAWMLGSMSQSGTNATITKDKIVMEGGEGFTVQGKPQSRTTTYELRTEDEMVVTNTNIRHDGHELPDEPVLVLKRVRAAHGQSTLPSATTD